MHHSLLAVERRACSRRFPRCLPVEYVLTPHKKRGFHMVLIVYLDRVSQLDHRKLLLRIQRFMHLQRQGIIRGCSIMHTGEVHRVGRARFVLWWAKVLSSNAHTENTEVARIDADACERPRRSRQTELLIPLIVEVPAWFCPWLRLYSRWTSSNGHAEDDWMMVVCGVCLMGDSSGNWAFG